MCALSSRGYKAVAFAASIYAAAASADTSNDALEMEEPLPHGFHNLFVILVIGTIVLWMMKVAWQLVRAADLNARLASHQSLQLEGMSIYANDFQMLIRQHFNQILRIRRTVPPKRVARHSLSVHAHPDSVTAYAGAGADRGPAEGGAFGVQFTVDAMVPCCVKLYWGVSVAACNEFGRQYAGPGNGAGEGSNATGPSRWGSGAAAGGRQRRTRPGVSTTTESTRSLLEMEEMNGSAPLGAIGIDGESQSLFAPGMYIAQSRDFFLPAGSGQRYATPAGDLMDQSQLNFDLGAPWLRDGLNVDESTVMPLAIVCIAQRRQPSEFGEVQGVPIVEAQGEVTFVKFRKSTGPSGFGPSCGIPEIVRQLSFGDRAVHEIQGIYGFEEDEGDGECMICYSRPKNVLLLPCRHCSVCHPCLRSLRDEKCPLCRSVFSSYVTFPIQRAGASSQATEESPPLPPSSADSEGPSGGSSAGGSSGLGPAGSQGDASGGGASADAGGASGGAAGSDGTGGSGGKDASDSGASGLQMQVSGVSARQVLLAPGTSANQEATSPPCAAPALPAPPVPVRSARGAAPAAMSPLEVRSATPREAASARPRGTASAPRTQAAQGRRLSGRARFSETRADTADKHEDPQCLETPLLQEGGNSPAREAGVETEADDCRREQASALATDAPTEETCILADAV